MPCSVARGVTPPRSLKDLEGALNMRPGSIYASFGRKERLSGEVLARYGSQGPTELERTLTATRWPLGGDQRLPYHPTRLPNALDDDHWLSPSA